MSGDPGGALLAAIDAGEVIGVLHTTTSVSGGRPGPAVWRYFWGRENVTGPVNALLDAEMVRRDPGPRDWQCLVTLVDELHHD